MSILEENKVGVFAFTLHERSGALVEDGDGQPVFYLHGHGNILPGMEKALAGRKAGDSVSVILSPEDAYGEYQEEKELSYHRSHFGDFFRIIYKGMILPLEDNGEHVIFYVVDKNDDTITVSLNHPLAGKDLIFTANILQVRDALPAEISAKKAHGMDGKHQSSCSCC